jgi:hypothetical protein
VIRVLAGSPKPAPQAVVVPEGRKPQLPGLKSPKQELFHLILAVKRCRRF